MASAAHVAIGLAAGRLWAGREARPRALAGWMALFCALSLLPDADVVAFELGIPYGAPFGHRGASHSIAAALALGAVAGAVARSLRTGLLAAAVVATHGLLDAMTSGGYGVALLWPLSNERFFLPWQPIPVAPIGAEVFTSVYGLQVLAAEVAWFAPLFLWALWPRRRGAAR